MTTFAPPPPTADAAVDRMVARCEASCPAEERLALAQHLLERAQERRRQALDAEERIYAGGDAAARLVAQAATESANREVAADRQRAIAMLRVVTEDSAAPPSRVVESALLELLLALTESDARDEALTVAERIVRDAPSRTIAAQAWLAIAERAFEDADVARARDAYLATAAVPGADPQIVVYAKYKLAWTHLNLSDFAAACAGFREVTLGATQPLIAREAQRDFVRALVPLDSSPVEALAELRGIARDEAQVAELADRYEQALRDVGSEARADAFHATRSSALVP